MEGLTIEAFSCSNSLALRKGRDPVPRADISSLWRGPNVSPEKPGVVVRNCLLLPQAITAAVASLQHPEFLDIWGQTSALCTACHESQMCQQMILHHESLTITRILEDKGRDGVGFLTLTTQAPSCYSVARRKIKSI